MWFTFSLVDSVKAVDSLFIPSLGVVPMPRHITILEVVLKLIIHNILDGHLLQGRCTISLPLIFCPHIYLVVDATKVHGLAGK